MQKIKDAPKNGSRLHRHSSSTIKLIKRNYVLYFFLFPAFLYVIIFDYVPLYGIQIAFKNFKPALGIWGSQWVGFKHFINFFNSYQFWTILKNTLSISIYYLVASFPMPIILALVLNYTKSYRLKKFAQTVTYAPHFISTVVLVSMLNLFLSPNSGIINTLIKALGGEAVYFMGEKNFFIHIYVWSGIWQNTGWNSIIYMAALASVNHELHEAAFIDGANKIRRIWHIDLPALMPTAVILLILRAGSIMNVGFEKVILMQNDLILSVSEVISTYVYRLGLLNARYDYTTAIGLFNNIINVIILIIVNQVARKVNETSLW